MRIFGKGSPDSDRSAGPDAGSPGLPSDRDDTAPGYGMKMAEGPRMRGNPHAKWYALALLGLLASGAAGIAGYDFIRRHNALEKGFDANERAAEAMRRFCDAVERIRTRGRRESDVFSPELARAQKEISDALADNRDLARVAAIVAKYPTLKVDGLDLVFLELGGKTAVPIGERAGGCLDYLEKSLPHTAS